MTAQNYVPTGVMPYTANSGSGPLTLQDRGDLLSEVETFQANSAIAAVGNTTPVEITTSSGNYYSTGFKVLITGTGVVGVDDIVWTITVVNGTKFTLDTSTASGAAGAGGTAIAVNKGTLGKLIDAADIFRRTLGIAVGAAYTGAAAFPNTVSVTGNTTLTTVTTTGLTGTLERTKYGEDPVDLSDADHTLDSTTGSNWIRMLTNPAANRILTLRQSTAPLPVKGDWFNVMVLLGNSAFTVALQREGAGGGDYVAVLGDGVGAAGNNVASALVRFDGTDWKLLNVGGKFSFSGTDS